MSTTRPKQHHYVPRFSQDGNCPVYGVSYGLRYLERFRSRAP